MTNETHSGWSNYATWRINLELVDPAQYEHRECGRSFETVANLADTIRENVELYLADEASGGNGKTSLAYDYAMAFIAGVNWYEIAEAMVRDNDNIIITEDIPS